MIKGLLIILIVLIMFVAIINTYILFKLSSKEAKRAFTENKEKLQQKYKKAFNKAKKEAEQMVNAQVNNQKRDFLQGYCIKRVFYNGSYTIIEWVNGEKTKVNLQDGNIYDRQTGFLMCLAKRIYGDNFKKIMKTFVWDIEETEEAAE